MNIIRAVVATSLLAAAFSPRSANAQSAIPSDSAILSLIQDRIAKKKAVGVVVGVIDASGKRRVVAYGDPGPNRPPLDGNSVFEIGSITKVFTATVLADMALAGEVQLDDAVQKYLPATVRMPARGRKQITLANLSEQNSGLPRLPGNQSLTNLANPYAAYTVQQLYDFLSGYQLPRDPGAQYEYSNLGVGLLGHVLALKNGQSYETMVRSRVLEPLAMTHSGATLDPWMTDHLALGHNAVGNLTSNWDITTLAGAGALRSTANDMLNFLDANMHPGSDRLGRAMALAQTARAPAGTEMQIGLNWHIIIAGKDTVIWHNGGTGGYRTFIGFRPHKNIGVVVLSNQGGAGVDDIGFEVLRPQEPPSPLRYEARRGRNIVIDGAIDSAEWSGSPWTSDFVDIEGNARPRPSLRTRAKMQWDDNYLYIAAELEEPHVWATFTRRDAVIYHDPDFEIFIDPDGDTFNYYELEINALNTVWDLMLDKPYRDHGKANNAWDIAGLKRAVRINGTINDSRDRDRGWTVELALPWKVLKEYAPGKRAPKAGEEWRINFSRVEWDVDVVDGKYVKRNQPEHNWVWTPQGAIAMHMPERWGYVGFVD